jgi:retron-type reverse transcriptase
LLYDRYEWIVNLDLEKFFDNVHHDKLIQIIDNEIKDSGVTSLITKYLKIGVMVNRTFI